MSEHESAEQFEMSDEWADYAEGDDANTNMHGFAEAYAAHVTASLRAELATVTAELEHVKAERKQQHDVLTPAINAELANLREWANRVTAENNLLQSMYTAKDVIASGIADKLAQVETERYAAEELLRTVTAERDEWKQICANRDKTVVEYRQELIKAKTERDALRQALVKSYALHKLRSSRLVSSKEYKDVMVEAERALSEAGAEGK